MDARKIVVGCMVAGNACQKMGVVEPCKPSNLTEAVATMGRIQLGKQFMPEENGQIVAFLKTLTGDQPNIRLPILPPSSDRTPRPQPFARN